MAYPIIRGVNKGFGGGTSMVFSLPSGSQQGDLLIVAIAFNTGTQTSFALSGWTLLVSPVSSGTDLAHRVYTKVRAAQEPANYTATYSNSNEFTWTTIVIQEGTWDPNATIAWNYKSQTGTNMITDSLTAGFGAVPHLRLQLFAYVSAASALNSFLIGAGDGGTYYLDDTYTITAINRANVQTFQRGLVIFHKQSDLATVTGLTMTKQGTSRSNPYQIAIKGLEPPTPTPDWKPNIGGLWKTTDSVHVNIGGVWKQASNLYVNIGGVWKESIRPALQKWDLMLVTSSEEQGDINTSVDEVLTGNEMEAYLNENFNPNNYALGTTIVVEDPVPEYWVWEVVVA